MYFKCPGFTLDQDKDKYTVSYRQGIGRQEAVIKFSLYFVFCLHPEIPKAPSVSSYLQLHNIAFFIMPVSIVIVLFKVEVCI